MIAWPLLMGGEAFDKFYYGHCCGQPYVRNEHWLGFFGGIAGRIVTDMAPGRVLDAGCAMGFLVEALRDRDIDAHGIDVSSYAIEQVHPPVKPFCRVGSITDDLGGDYDLIVSIEVAEHMPTRAAEQALANICAHTTDVLFSSSPIDYREPTHVNVQPPEYWAEQFARHGFYRDVDYDATYILPWAARFRKRADPIHSVVRNYERRYWELLRAATDARNYATDLQRTFVDVETERDALLAERNTLLTERNTLLIERDTLRRERDLLTTQSAHLGETIASMERSRGWKLLLLWRRIRDAVRPPRRPS